MKCGGDCWQRLPQDKIAAVFKAGLLVGLQGLSAPSFTQRAARRKSLVCPSLCLGITPGSPVGWWRASSAVTVVHWWLVCAFLGCLKQLQFFLVNTFCAQHFMSGSSPLFSWFGETRPTSSLWFKGPTRAALPVTSFQAVSHSAKHLSAASFHNAFLSRTSKQVRMFVVQREGIDLPHCPTVGINNFNDGSEGTEKVAILHGGKNHPWGCGSELVLMKVVSSKHPSTWSGQIQYGKGQPTFLLSTPEKCLSSLLGRAN